MEELAIGEVARRAGIRPSAARWQPLAQQKIAELDALIVRAQQMKRILENGLNCGCLRMEDCAIELERGCSLE